ncbi:hypothetical protein HK104_000561, partial [Borealophlyctis nickersoniae]
MNAISCRPTDRNVNTQPPHPQVATDFPKSTVTGLDISAVQPTTIKPSNLDFLVHNLNDPLPFPSDTFDLVRMRFLVLGLTTEQWPKVISELVRVTKPGGYVELSEPDARRFLESGVTESAAGIAAQ